MLSGKLAGMHQTAALGHFCNDHPATAIEPQGLTDKKQWQGKMQLDARGERITTTVIKQLNRNTKRL